MIHQSRARASFKLGVFALCMAGCHAIAEDEAGVAFREACAKQAADAGIAMAVTGADGWLFLNNELRHLGVGPFWGEAAAKVSMAKPEHADPLPAIRDFKQQLDAHGIELILVPVPPKAMIFPDKISDAVKAPPDGKPPARLEAAHQAFYTLLRDKGINVLDLTDDFLAHRVSDDGPIYCLQDAHWVTATIWFSTLAGTCTSPITVSLPT